MLKKDHGGGHNFCTGDADMNLQNMNNITSWTWIMVKQTVRDALWVINIMYFIYTVFNAFPSAPRSASAATQFSIELRTRWNKNKIALTVIFSFQLIVSALGFL